jgi:Leucine-rich repeat (LRR) protein
MNSQLTDNYLNSLTDVFNNESNRIMNELKKTDDEKRLKYLNKESNLLRSIEMNIIKLKALRNIEKNKNL